MNWRFTRKHTPVAFEIDEPICMIFPVQRGLVESIEPEFRSFEADPKTKAAYDAWAARSKAPTRARKSGKRNTSEANPRAATNQKTTAPS
jgi:hypothetical protein